MKIRKFNLWPVCVLGGALVLIQAGAATAQAQNNVIPAGNGRFYVELKDATLADALELLFKASATAAYIIDPAAKEVPIGSVLQPNVVADSYIRLLANQNGFLVRKNQQGAMVVEPRAPAVAPGGTGAPGMPGGGGRPVTPTPRVPANPFGVSLEGGAETATLASAQIGGNRNTNTNNRNNRNTTGGNTGNNRNRGDLNPEGQYQLLIVKHIYAGGIARLFANGDVIPTELLVYPESAASGGGGLGGGGQVSGFGGGQQGGIGGQQGGFGGGGGIGGGGGFGGGIGGGGIGGFSDRALKENVSTVDGRAVLDRVAGLPIHEWNYKQQDASIRHIGPMAQDFASAFGVGEDNKRINFIDANGVALASIQALYQLTQQQAEQIAGLQEQIAALTKDTKPKTAD